MQIVKAGYKNGGAVAPLTLAGLTDVTNRQPSLTGTPSLYDFWQQPNTNKALELTWRPLADVVIANLADGDAMS